MKQCPKCNQYAMDFDEYFGRYRCFNANCTWMPPSAAERQLRLLERGVEPSVVDQFDLGDIGVSIRVVYDEVNDILAFNFDAEEPQFDYPSDDARIAWRVGRNTGQLCGLIIYSAKEFGLSEVCLDIIVARIGLAAKGITGQLVPITSNKPTRIVIDKIRVTLKGYRPTSEMCNAIKPTVEKAINNLVANQV